MLIESAAAMLVGAATPGPNNILAMQAGLVGRTAVARVIGGVVAGSFILLGVTWFAGTMVPPWVQRTLAIAGACYLAVLGISIALRSGDTPLVSATSTWRIALLQLGNPKAWIVAIALTAPLDRTLQHFTALLAIAAGISTVCLIVWASVGRLLGRSRVLDIISGVLLGAIAIEMLWAVIS